jgi:hypothetical protein
MKALTEKQKETIKEAVQHLGGAHARNITDIVYRHPTWDAFTVIDYYESL